MAEKRRGKQKRREDLPEKPTKEEYAVAKFLRFNLPAKEGKLVGMPVQYFIASKAVDALMESKWGSKAKKDPLFTSRASCVGFCDRLLQKGMFHRALRVEKKKDKKKKRPEIEDSSKEEKKGKEKKGKKAVEGDKEDEKDKDEEKSKEDKKDVEKKEKEDKKDEEKKKKKKAKLEMHDHQMFKDGDEIYVWIFDPVHVKTFLIGLLLVLGAIAVCLFPLWPPEVRLGVYYLSLAAAGFVGFILFLCVVRMVLFCVMWAATFGKQHFWFLPNLTEDVGFFDSFKPLYTYEIVKKDSEDSSKTEKEKVDTTEGKNKSITKPSSEKENGENNDQDQEKEQESGTGSEMDNDNGYEIVDAKDVNEDDEPKKTK